MGRWMVFWVEQEIEFLGEKLEKVSFQISFCMIDGSHIGVGTEKLENDPGESNDRDGNSRIFFSEGGDQWREHDGISVTFSGKNNNTFEFANKERGRLSASAHDFCV